MAIFKTVRDGERVRFTISPRVFIICLFLVLTGPADGPPWTGHSGGRAGTGVCHDEEVSPHDTAICWPEAVHQGVLQQWRCGTHPRVRGTHWPMFILLLPPTPPHRPSSVFVDPLIMDRAEVCDAISLDANEVLVVYQQMREDGGIVRRRIQHGPTLFTPTADEWWACSNWCQQWHGSLRVHTWHVLGSSTIGSSTPTLSIIFALHCYL